MCLGVARAVRLLVEVGVGARAPHGELHDYVKEKNVGGKSMSDKRFAELVKMVEAEGNEGIPLAAFKKVMRSIS